MSGNSTYVQQSVAEWFLGTPMPAAPSGLVLALSRVSISDDGSNIDEPGISFGYTRETINFTTPVHTENDGTRISNSNAIIFGPIVSSGWGTIVAAAVFDQSGNMLFKGDLAAPRVAPEGDTLSFGVDTVEFKVK